MDKIERPQSRQPIPPEAERVFKGVYFDTYQWQQKMFDGSYATFEKIRRPDSTLVVPVTVDGKIIVSEQEQPGKKARIGVLGGVSGEGENPIEAAKRELLEESGCEAQEMVLWEAFQPMGRIDWAIYTFIARGCRKVCDQNLDPGEKIKLRLVSFDQFVKIASTEGFYDIEITLKVLQARLDPRKMDELKALFGIK